MLSTKGFYSQPAGGHFPHRNCPTGCSYNPLSLSASHSLHSAFAGYFWHISDLHLDTFYSTQGDIYKSCWQLSHTAASSSSSVRQQTATEAPGPFGHYNCDSPWSLVESAVKTMKAKQGDNVEFVLWTGDALSHSAQALSEQKQLETLRNITELLGRSFSSPFIFPVLGHEDGSSGPHKYKQMGELWRHWLPTDALVTFELGGYYSIEQTRSRLRIVALNTNFMRYDYESELKPAHSLRWPAEYVVEPKASSRTMSAQDQLQDQQQAEQQWLWLDEVLAKSRDKQETVSRR